MTFVANDNLIAILRNAAGYTSATTTDVSGTSRAIVDPTSARATGIPFFVESGSASEAAQKKLYCYASSNLNPLANEIAVTNQVGTAVVQYTINSKGWTAIIKITGTQGDTINSLYFTKLINYTSTSNAESLLFVVKLDSPVTIDSTGEANFTFAIEF